MTRTMLSSLAVAAMLSVAASNPVVAAEEIPLTYEKMERSNAGAKKQFKSGAKSQSKSQDKHKGEIDVLSWSWGATQSGSGQRPVRPRLGAPSRR